MGPEDPVDPGKDGAVVAVDGPVPGVVPVVKCGSGDQPFQRPEAPAQIGVDEEPPHYPDQGDQDGHLDVRPGPRFSQTQHIDWNQRTESAKYHVDRMGAGTDQEVKFLGAVMDGME